MSTPTIINNLPKGNVKAPQGAIMKINTGEQLHDANFNNNTEFVLEFTQDNLDPNGNSIYVRNGITEDEVVIGNNDLFLQLTTIDNFDDINQGVVGEGNFEFERFFGLQSIDDNIIYGYVFFNPDTIKFKETLKTIDKLIENKIDVNYKDNNDEIQTLLYFEINKVIGWSENIENMFGNMSSATYLGDFGKILVSKSIQKEDGQGDEMIVPAGTYFQRFKLNTSTDPDFYETINNLQSANSISQTTALSFKNGNIYLKKQYYDGQQLNEVEYLLNTYYKIGTGTIGGTQVSVYGYNDNEIAIFDYGYASAITWEGTKTYTVLSFNEVNAFLKNFYVNSNDRWISLDGKISLELGPQGFFITGTNTDHQHALYFKPEVNPEI